MNGSVHFEKHILAFFLLLQILSLVACTSNSTSETSNELKVSKEENKLQESTNEIFAVIPIDNKSWILVQQSSERLLNKK